MVHFVAKYDDTIEPPIEDETSHAFDDWFKNAYKYVDEDGYIRDSRYPDGGHEDNLENMNTEKLKIGEEMTGNLRKMHGDQKNKDADENYGNEHHTGRDMAKTMDKVYHSESRINRDTSAKSSASNVSASVRHPEETVNA
jgi:hypothetical protein